MEERSADVQALAARSREQRRRRDVDDDPDAGECEHEPTVDVRRRDEAPHRGVDDPEADEDERDAVRERGQNLDAPKAERPAPARRAPRDRGGDKRERKRGRVREHVPGVGEQRERARDDPDRDLGDEQADDEREGSRQHPPVRRVVMLVPRHGLDRSERHLE